MFVLAKRARVSLEPRLSAAGGGQPGGPAAMQEILVSQPTRWARPLRLGLRGWWLAGWLADQLAGRPTRG